MIKGMKYTQYRPALRNKRVIVLAVTSLVILGAAVGGYLVWHHGKTDSGSKNKAESAQVLTAVGQLYMLPSNEQPTVAAIQDITKLSGQAFFKNAQNGDYLLVYSNAKLALLYRKSVNKLVNVGPVSLGNNAASSAKQ